MSNYFEETDDIQFYFNEGIDWKSLIDDIEGDYTGVDAPTDWQEALGNYRDIMHLVGQFSAEEVEPRAPIMDKKGTHMEDGVVKASPEHEEIFAMLKEMDFYGICVPRELGGMGCPGLVYLFICELVGRADVSTLTHFGFHVATTITLITYAIEEGSAEFDEKGRLVKTRFDDVIKDIMSGNAWGSMDLTEPDAGSDLARLRTKAVLDENNTWRITGNKIFITSGHGQYHLVLAKTKNEESLSALSLFLVPLSIERDGETIKNAWVDRVEEKIGHHGSPTCSVMFENSEGELIGNVGDGFKLMLKLMNHARLGVGFESIGVCEAAYRAAKAYAAERVSMGCTIDQHPLIADMLDEMDVTIRGIRALAVKAAIAEEKTLAHEVRRRTLEKDAPTELHAHQELKKLKTEVRLITPMLKYIASEEAVRFSRMSMQIHGGNGYTTDYAPERYLRDALVLPVYEGTSQIQALMCLKDNLGAITKNPQAFLKRVAASKFNAMRATDPLERGFHKLQSMAYAAQQHIIWKVAKEKWSDAMTGPWDNAFNRFTKNWDPKKDFAYGQLHAENLIRILTDTAIAEALVEQAQRFPERRSLAHRWLERAEPRVRYRLDLIHSTGDRLLNELQTQQAEEKTA